MTSSPRIRWGLLVLVGALLSGCGGDASEQATPALPPVRAPVDPRIVPGVSIGPVSAETSEADLIAALGADQVIRREAQIGEGFCAPGSVLFAGTPDELEVIWEDTTYSKPAGVSTRRAGSRWRTPAGVRIGTSLAVLDSLAGGPIEFMGFNWDYGGSGAWVEGADTTRLVSFLLGPDSASAARAGADPRYGEIVGDRIVRSDHPLVRSMNILVERLSIRLGESRDEHECRAP